jgi:hypothetical protein
VSGAATPRDCQHGRLARSCELCELYGHLEADAATIAQLRAERDAALALLAEWVEWQDENLAPIPHPTAQWCDKVRALVKGPEDADADEA